MMSSLRWQVVVCTILSFWPFYDVNFHFLQWFIIDIHVWWIHIWQDCIPNAATHVMMACESRLEGTWCQCGWQWHWTFYLPHCIDSLSWYWWERWWWRTPSILYSLILKVINQKKPHHADSAQHRCQINQSGRIRPTKELFVMDLRRSESPITDHHGHQHHHRDWPHIKEYGDRQKKCIWCKCFFAGVVDAMSHMALLELSGNCKYSS